MISLHTPTVFWAGGGTNSIRLLPAFQVAESLYVSAIQVQTLNGLHVDRFLVINDSIGKTVRGVNVFVVLSNLSMGKTFITCIVGRSVAAECLYLEHEKLLLKT